MLDLGWTELLLIGIVALIVVGPKDLPGMFQAVGRFIGKAKGMAREFSRAMNDAADQSGVGDIQKTFKSASNPMKTAMNELKKTSDSVTADLKEVTRPPLDPERQAAADKIREKAAEMATARRTAEAEAEAKGAATAKDAAPEAAKKPAKKAASKTASKPAKKAVKKTAAAPADSTSGDKS